MSFGENLKKLREKNSYSQTELAHRMRITQANVAMWETGAAMPRADKLPALAKILGCEVSDLFKKEA